MIEKEINAVLTSEQTLNAVIELEPLRGAQGYSAYELAVRNGYKGTEAEWTDSLAKTNYYKEYRNVAVIEADETDNVRMDFSSEESNFILKETDIIEVKVNNLCLVKDLDYSISSNTKKTINIIRFTEPLTNGSIVEYKVFRTLVANNEDYDKLKGDRGASALLWNDEETSGETYLDVIDEFINALPNGTAEGEVATMYDSTEYPLLELSIEGKSVQDGTPTPDAPVEITNVKGSEGVGLEIESNNRNFLKSIVNYQLVINGEATYESINDYLKINMPASPFVHSGVYFRNYGDGLHILELLNKLKGKKCTYSFYARADKERSITFQFGDAEVTYINLTTEWKRFSRTMVINGKQVPTFYCGNTLDTSSFYIKDIMLELEDLTDYEAHKENSILIDMNEYELCSIGDVKDIQELSKNKNRIIQRIGKGILDETIIASIVTANSTDTHTQFNITFSEKAKTTRNTLCDCFPVNHTVGNPDVNEEGITLIHKDNVVLRILNSRLSEVSVSALQNYLKENPVTFYYEMLEPITIEKDIIKLPKTYKNVSNISTNDELNPNLKVKYLKDIETLLGGVNNG